MRARTTALAATAAAAVLLTSTASAVAASAGGQAASHATAATADGCTTWQTAAAPTPPDFGTPEGTGIDDSAGIASISALSPGDTWFSGFDQAGSTTSPWVLHATGMSLRTPAQPDPIPPLQETGGNPVFMEQPASFDSDKDGWVIMVSSANGLAIDNDLTTAEHWHNGRWVLTPMGVSPDPADQSPAFSFPATTGTELAAISPGNAWAVGALYATGQLALQDGSLNYITGALIEHWNGTDWSVVPNPAMSHAGADLNSVDVVTPSDIWAVGHQGAPNQGSSTGQAPLIEHWNGSTWSVVSALAPPGTVASELWGVSADSDTDAWAVGEQKTTPSAAPTPLIEHWNGTTWTIVSLTSDADTLDGLWGVYAASPQDVWAIEGGASAPDDQVVGGGLLLHWDGQSWAPVPGPGPVEYGFTYTYQAIGGDGPGNVWLAGDVADGYTGATLPLIARLDCGSGGQS
jgi:hypothetical protein